MLIVAILMFSKRSDYRTIAKISLAPGIFNIGEPILLGLPVVLNPVYLIPFVLAPLVNVAFSYWVSIMGLVNLVQVALPSILHPAFGSYSCTSFCVQLFLCCSLCHDFKYDFYFANLDAF